MPRPIINKLLGCLLVAITILVILSKWRQEPFLPWAANILIIPVLLLLWVQVRWTRQIFILVGLALAIIAVSTRHDWLQVLHLAFGSAAFIAAFFTALAQRVL